MATCRAQAGDMCPLQPLTRAVHRSLALVSDMLEYSQPYAGSFPYIPLCTQDAKRGLVALLPTGSTQSTVGYVVSQDPLRSGRAVARPIPPCWLEKWRPQAPILRLSEVCGPRHSPIKVLPCLSSSSQAGGDDHDHQDGCDDSADDDDEEEDNDNDNDDDDDEDEDEDEDDDHDGGDGDDDEDDDDEEQDDRDEEEEEDDRESYALVLIREHH